MDFEALPVIFFRWLHVMTAAVAIGGVVFIRLILPVGLKQLDPESARSVLLKCRRVFKMVIHTAILFLLVSGSYNGWRNWAAYKNAVPLSHAFFGIHVLLGLIVFTIALFVLAGREPPRSHKKLMLVNIVLLVLVVAAASTLKWVREHPKLNTSPTLLVLPGH